jgi:C-terminal processing protease CtpA/Prc
MKRVSAWLVIGSVLLAGSVAFAADDKDSTPAEKAPKEKKPKKANGTLEAQRAGWLLGMYLGEGRGQPYPFVTQVDPDSDARKMGVKAGDEIIRWQEREIQSLQRIFDEVNGLKPGAHVTFWVRRGVQPIKFELRVPKEPGAPGSEASEKKKKGEEAKAKDGEEKKDGESADGEKKKKKKSPIVVKPIPSDDK